MNFFRRLFAAPSADAGGANAARSVTGRKFLDYTGLVHLVEKLKSPICDTLLAASSAVSWTRKTLSGSMANYKFVTAALVVDGETRGMMNIPTPLLQTRNAQGKAFRISYTVDYGEISCWLYYNSATAVTIKTTENAQIELYGII